MSEKGMRRLARAICVICATFAVVSTVVFLVMTAGYSGD